MTDIRIIVPTAVRAAVGEDHTVTPAVGSLTLAGYAASLLDGASLYVDAAATGSDDGSDWTNAWPSLSDINWGSVDPGTTIYIGAGSYGALTIAASGTSSERIYIRAAQETNVGVATFSSVNFDRKSYITIDGEYQGGRNFSVTNGSVSAGGGVSCVSPSLKYCTLTYSSGGNNGDANSTAIDFRWVANGEFAYNQVDIRGSVYGTPLNMVAPQHSSAYGQGSVHHNTFYLPGRINDGNGPDGMHAGNGYDIYNNTWQSFNTGSGNSSQHQDQIQAFGANYLRIYNNTFIDSGDAQVDFSGVDEGHLYFYNNTLVRTINDMGTVGIRIYGPPQLTSLEDVHIDNNTFVDAARTAGSFGAAMRVQDTAGSTITNCNFRNNIIYNCGDAWPAVLIEGNAAGWNSSNNLVNAGSEGNTDISGLTNTNGQTGAPTFESYTAYSLANDLDLAAGDTAAKDNGVTIGYFSEDKDGTARPQGAAWDIGSHEDS